MRIWTVLEGNSSGKPCTDCASGEKRTIRSFVDRYVFQCVPFESLVEFIGCLNADFYHLSLTSLREKRSTRHISSQRRLCLIKIEAVSRI